MTAFLLDVNVLVALMWPAHELHARVQAWFARHARRGWATCPMTQTGFARIVSNPAFSPHAVQPLEAVRLLGANLRHRHHYFWPDDLTLAGATERVQGNLAGHRQLTDAYLIALALHRKGKLATLDRAIDSLLAPDSPVHQLVEFV